MKTIILIQPKVGYLENFQDAPLFPMALMSISSFLVDDYDIRIIDQRIDKNWEETLKQALKSNVLCVGITTMTGPQILSGMQASKIVREYTDVPIVWGGIHPTSLPEQTVSHPLVDIVIEGEGEIAFRDLVYALDEDRPFVSLPGIWTMQNGVPSGSSGEMIRNLTDLPSLPFHLVDMEHYIGKNSLDQRKLAIKTSRGCPHHCYFCHQTRKKQRKWRALPAERCLTDMEQLMENFSIHCFHILDDNFFVNKHRIQEFLNGLMERKWDITYIINGTRVSDILEMTDDMLKLLAQTGCSELQIGLESGSQKMLDHMKKDTTLEQIKEANRRLERQGLTRYYEILSGHKGETAEDIQQTADLILELSERNQNVYFAPLEILTPYPGTAAFEEAQKAGMVYPKSLEDWAEYGWDRALLPWIDDKRKRLLERFHLFPTVISSRIKTERRKMLQIMYKVYRPVARFRVRHMFFGFPLELAIFRLLSRLREE